jgi:FKBP-type peptidyl-prolyl cis-trans isomerase FkpA
VIARRRGARHSRILQSCAGLALVCALTAPAVVAGDEQGSAGAGTADVVETPVTPIADDDAAYALGMLTARGIDQLALSDAEWESFLRALRDHRRGGAPLDLAAGLPGLDRFQRERAAAVIETATAENATFLADAAAEEGAERLPSGAIVRVLEPGAGPAAQATDRVTLRFTGWLRDGTRFDSSDARDAPGTYTFDLMIPCWGQPLLRARVGAKLRITCPPQLAYGDTGAPPVIPPAAALRFDLEILAAEPQEPAPKS